MLVLGRLRALAYSLHYYMAAPRAMHVRPGFSGDRRFDRRFASIAVEWADKTGPAYMCVCIRARFHASADNVPVLCSPIASTDLTEGLCSALNKIFHNEILLCCIDRCRLRSDERGRVVFA